MQVQSLIKKLVRLDYLAPFKRLPAAAAMSIALGVIALILVWIPVEADQFSLTLMRTAFFLFVAYLSSTGVHLVAERKSLSVPIHSLLISMAVVTSFVLSFLAFPNTIERAFLQVNMLQMLVLAASAFSLPFVLPYIGRSDLSASFWNFSYVVLRRLAILFFAITVLVLGLAAAFGAIDILLDIQVDGRILGSIAAIAYSGAFPYLALLTAPKKLEQELKLAEFPISILRICQYVLIPLLVIFLVILYLYLIRELPNSELPSNQFVPLTLGFLLPGFVTVVALFPLRVDPERGWIREFIKRFSIAILPLMFAYFYGIGVRMSTYGITPARLYVVLTGVYIVLLAIYLLRAKSPRLSWMVAGYVLIIFVPTFMPAVNVFSISEQSQYTRLAESLEAKSLLRDGELTRQDVVLTRGEYYDLADEIRYVIDAYGDAGLTRWFTESEIESALSSSGRYSYNTADELLEIMGVKLEGGDSITDPRVPLEKQLTVSRNSSREEFELDISEFERMAEFVFYGRTSERRSIQFDNFRLDFSTEGLIELVTSEDDTYSLDILSELSTNTAIQNASYYYQASTSELTLETESFTVVLDNVELYLDATPENSSVLTAEGRIFIRYGVIASGTN